MLINYALKKLYNVGRAGEMPKSSVGGLRGLMGCGDRERIQLSVTMASNAVVFRRIQACTLSCVLCGSKLPWPT